jgi:hypothetical protein
VAPPPAVKKPRRQPPPERLQAAAPEAVASAPQTVASAPGAVASAPEPAASETKIADQGQVAPPEQSASAPTPTAPAVATAASAPASAAIASTPADSWPPDTRLRYHLSGTFRGGPLYGSARVLWQRTGTDYQARVEVDVTPFAKFSMTSQGDIAEATLLPRAYEESTNGRIRTVRFGAREVMLGDGRTFPRPPAVQDTASQFVELSHRFATGRERLEVGKPVVFWMARPGGLDEWTYDVIGRDTLRTALGPVDAFHLRPRMIASPRGNFLMDIWYAPSLQYLPVRILVRNGSDAEIDLLVEAVDQR